MVEKLVQKRIQRNTTENVIQERKLEERGIAVSKSSAVKLGRCLECGKILVRFNKEVDTAVCTCKSVVDVPLTVSITRVRYEDGKRLAKEMSLEGCGTYYHLLQRLLNDVFEIESVEVR